MKKIICLLLLSVLACSLIACGDSRADEILAAVENSEPTKIVTIVNYVKENEGLPDVSLNSQYTIELDGDNSIAAYRAERLASPTDTDADGPIKTVEGTLYYKDGKYSLDGEEWGAQPPYQSAKALALKLDKADSHEVSADGTTLTVKLSGENAADALGTDLKPVGTVTVEIVTVGEHVTRIFVSYTTESGARVEINTSYSYNKLTLTFPTDGQ